MDERTASRPVDLTTAPREVLLAVITAQQQTITTLEGRVVDLERRLGSSGGGAMPGTKPSGQTRSRATGKARRKRPHGYARRRSPTPTHHVRHAADTCPDCGTALTGGWVQRRREVLELPAAPVQVISHEVIARRCTGCGRRVVPTVDLGGVVAGRQRLGTGLVSLIVTLREVGRLPVRTIQWFLRTVHGLSLSVGAIVGASHRVGRAAAGTVRAIRDQIRASPAVQADETGWRQDGHNGYIWSFSTPTAAYFTHGRRTGAMVDTVLGEQCAGVLGSDFYAGYHHYPGLHQRCWVHLLRAIHDLRTLYPDDRAVRRWARAVRAVFDWARARAQATAADQDRGAAKARAEAALARQCQRAADDPAAPHGRLCRRILRHLAELFVFVTHPEVPPDNNGAERSIRPLVARRKVSGGSRSAAGTAATMALATVLGTARLRGRDPLLTCFEILVAPQP